MFSMIDTEVYLKYDIKGRARWGISGALYLQSARAGLNSLLRNSVIISLVDFVMLMFGPHATKPREPRQVRKEATVTRIVWVAVPISHIAITPPYRGVFLKA